MSIEGKKSLKEIEGAVVEKVTVNPDKGTIKIKTGRGTVTVTFSIKSISTDTEYSAGPAAEVNFKPAKVDQPKILKPDAAWPATAQTNWPFPTGCKP